MDKIVSFNSFSLSYRYSQSQTALTEADSQRATVRTQVDLQTSQSSSRSLTYGADGLQASQNVGQESTPRNPAAENILTFIEAQIARDIADDAAEESLETGLQAGLDGFLRGFGEAYDQLVESGLFTNDVSELTESTYNQVIEGIEELANRLDIDSPVTDAIRDRFISRPDVAEQGDTLTEPATSRTINTGEVNVDSELNNDVAKTVSYIRSSSEYLQQSDVLAEYGVTTPESNTEKLDGLGPFAQFNGISASISETRSFDFSLTTREGDRVSIQLATARGSQADYVSYDGENASAASASSERFSVGNFVFTVEGDLNEEELSAINELLAQVNQVTDEFFNGDLYLAFEKALDIGFDSEQINQFSLDLYKEQVTRIQSVYTEAPEFIQPVDIARDNLQQAESQKLLNMLELIDLIKEGFERSENLGIERQDFSNLVKFVALENYREDSRLPIFNQLVDRISEDT